MQIINLALEHKDGFNATVVKRLECVGLTIKRNQIRFNNDAAGITANMAKKIILMASTCAFPLNLHPRPGFCMHRRPLFFKLPKKCG